MVTSSDPDDFESMFDPEFAIVRRGFDPGEVRRRLLQISGELRAARERELLLARQLEVAEARAEAAEARAEAVDPLDPAYLTKLLGDEVVRILDAARSAAAEIRQRAEGASVRLLEELKSEAGADASAVAETAAAAEAETDAGDEAEVEAEAVSASGAEVQAESEPEAVAAGEPAPRSRRTGIDPARTNDLFASLRAHQDAPSPARPKRTAPSKPTTPPKSTVPSKRTVPSKSATPTKRTPSPNVVALTTSLARAVRRQLTDDFNSLLALVAVTGRRITPVPTELPEGAAPTAEQYIELVESLLDEQFPADVPARESVIEEAARCVAHDLVVPLRIRIDAVLASGAADPSGLSGELRALFREWRDDRVGPAIGAVQSSLPQMGEPRPD
jgi:hypothetical protein